MSAQNSNNSQDSSTNERSNKLSNTIMMLVAIGFLVVALSYPHLRAYGGYGEVESSPVSTPVFIPPPSTNVGGVFNPRVPVFVQQDVTGTDISNPVTGANSVAGLNTNLGVSMGTALSGVLLVNDSEFPIADNLKGSTEWITVRATPGSQFTRPTPYTIDLKQGSVLISVKRPSETAIVKTPLGEIAISSDGDAIVTYENGQLRVMNLDGVGKSVVAKIIPPGQADPTVALAAGYELVASDHKLTRAEMKPKDGIARRHFNILENGQMAVSEFSVESAIHSSTLIADLKQNVSGVKERRILGDMAKMASVLNYVHGTQGFRPEK